MSLLVIQIPPKPRLHARDMRSGTGADAHAPSGEFCYVWSPDGRQVGRNGCTGPALLPKADSVVAVVSNTDLGWHRVLVPKAPPARLRAALVGVMEELLLDDGELTHLALAPQAKPGETAWVAAAHRGWLGGELAALEAAQVFVDRVVPAAWPGEPALGHFDIVPGGAGDSGSDGALSLTWVDAEGVATLELQGGLARAMLPQPLPAEARFSATPAAAAAAEAWLSAPVSLQTANERLLQSAVSPWDLRQFELVRRHRGTRALRDAWRALLGPDWRPVRYGIAALLVVQLLGLNLWAWQLRRQVSDKQAKLVSVLQTTFPQVRAVLDAPLQMEREVQTLRSQAGKAGDTDLEPLMLAAAAAWPLGRPPVDALRYEPGRLSLSAVGWAADEVDRFRAQLRGGGYAVEQAEGRLNISRVSRAAAS